MHANLPRIAKRWERDYANGGIMRLAQGGRIGFRLGAAATGGMKGTSDRGMSTGDVSGGKSGNGNGGPDTRDDRFRTQRPKSKYTAVQAGTLSDPREKKDYFEQSWTGPSRFLGLGGGYKNLNVPGDTAGGHQSRFGLGSLLRGAASMFGGIPGRVGSMLSRIDPRQLRGKNPDGSWRTQKQYNEDRQARRDQKRMSYLSDRKSRGLGYGRQAYSDLIDAKIKDPFQEALNRDLQINPETTQFATTHLQSLANKQALINKLSAQNYNYGSTPFDPSQGGIMNIPQSKASMPDFMWSSPQFTEGLDNSMYGGDRYLVGSKDGTRYYTGDRFPEGHPDMPSEYGITRYDFDNARDFPLKGTFDKDAWEYNQPEEWQTQEFPVREDFLPQEKMTSSITQTGKPMINDAWRWNRW